MSKLCTIILLTYRRPKEFVRCFESYLEFETEKSELIVYARTDDIRTMMVLPEVCPKLPGMKLILGDNLTGYQSHCTFIREALRMADGEWVMVQSDDCTFESAWEGQVEREASGADILTPKTWLNGGSAYENDADCPFFFVRKSELSLALSVVREPYDRNLLHYFRQRERHQKFLDGFQVWHENLAKMA